MKILVNSNKLWVDSYPTLAIQTHNGSIGAYFVFKIRGYRNVLSFTIGRRVMKDE